MNEQSQLLIRKDRQLKRALGVRIGYFCLALLILRMFLSGVVGMNTTILTLILNIVLLLTCLYVGLERKFYFIFLMLPIAIYNMEILATIDVILFLYLLRNASILRLALFSAILMSLGLLILYISDILGYIDLHKNIYYSHRENASHAFGFSNSNTFGQFIFSLLCCCYIVFARYKVIWVYLAFLLPFSGILYDYSQSRSLMICPLVLVGTHLLLRCGLIRNWMRYVIGILPFTLFFIGYYISEFDTTSELNELSTGRFSKYSIVFASMTPINWIIGVRLPQGIPMDGSYWMLLFGGGIFWAIFFYYNFYKTLVHHFTKLLNYLPVILGVLAFGVAENIFWACNSISIIFWLLILKNYIEAPSYTQKTNTHYALRSSHIVYAPDGRLYH